MADRPLPGNDAGTGPGSSPATGARGGSRETRVDRTRPGRGRRGGAGGVGKADDGQVRRGAAPLQGRAAGCRCHGPSGPAAGRGPWRLLEPWGRPSGRRRPSGAWRRGTAVGRGPSRPGAARGCPALGGLRRGESGTRGALALGGMGWAGRPGGWRRQRTREPRRRWAGPRQDTRGASRGHGVQAGRAATRVSRHGPRTARRREHRGVPGTRCRDAGRRGHGRRDPGPATPCGQRFPVRAALGVTSRLPDQSLAALKLLVWARPAVVAASPMSLGST